MRDRLERKAEFYQIGLGSLTLFCRCMATNGGGKAGISADSPATDGQGFVSNSNMPDKGLLHAERLPSHVTPTHSAVRRAARLHGGWLRTLIARCI